MSQKCLTIGIIDYRVGNIRSLINIIKILGHQAILGNQEKSFISADILLLPGVGSMGFAMNQLRQTRMDKFITKRFDCRDIPIVGICLGMQLLFEFSEEDKTNGLGLLSGKVSSFNKSECHVGWNLVGNPSWIDHTGQPSAYYFNHSYKVSCSKDIICKTFHLQEEIPAVIKSKLFTGVQFHPEKSQMAGYNLFKDTLLVV
jgi:imidazole glycerol-phosphate synthase subunit HisH